MVVGPHQGHDQGPFFRLTGRPIQFIKRWLLLLERCWMVTASARTRDFSLLLFKSQL